jgi:hypothetical protein
MRLYKYFPDTVNSFKSLSVKGIWCHYPKMMNDPADCLAYLEREITIEEINIFKSYFEKNIHPHLNRIFNFSNDQISEFLNIRRKEFVNRYAFGSFSETFDDILMWSHYASSHTGFVVEFEFEDSKIDHHFQKIIYTDYLPKFDVSKLAEFLIDKDENLDYLLQDLSLKSTAWSSEKEWRIWRSKPSYYHYEAENIKNIYFGVNSNIETKSIVSKLVSEFNKEVLYHFMEFSQNPVKLILKS